MLFRSFSLFLFPSHDSRPSKKNGYNPPKCTDMRTYYVPTKCGRCIECRQQRQREWIVRLSEELRENNNALFVTLTFDKRKTQEIKGIDENDTQRQ